MTGSSGTEEGIMTEITFAPGDATRVHYATDPRIRGLAEAAWRLRTGGSHMEWLTLGKDNPDALITEAREWVRAAVAGGIMPPPEPSPPALGAVPAGVVGRPFEALCSFCGVTSERATIVQGPGCAICGDCIELVATVHDETDQPVAAHGSIVRRDRGESAPGRYCSLCERVEYTPACPNERADGWGK